MFASPISLSEFNALVKDVLNEAFPEKYWVTAEIAECKTNASGHCYLELIEKKAGSDQLLARSKAVIWANVWYFLSAQFQLSTGVALSRGQKVLIEVSLTFHELYGMSLVITDIDPAYTLGDWAKRRQEILLRLKADGVLDLNKELPWPLLPQRLAVISSATAAGYEDFCVQLKESGFVYQWQLFPAIMQGEQAESSILQALDAILDQAEHFDVVILIRGGGATADLSCFDSYELCASLAQFPLPVLTGIGHERDESVADIVAYRALKTPTAVAEFLNGKMMDNWEQLSDYQNYLEQYTQQFLRREKQALQLFAHQLKASTDGQVHRQRMELQKKTLHLQTYSQRSCQQQRQKLSTYKESLRQRSLRQIEVNKHAMALMQTTLKMYNPQEQLQRGYSLTLRRGKIVKSVQALQAGDSIEVRFRDGSLLSQVKEVKSSSEMKLSSEE